MNKLNKISVLTGVFLFIFSLPLYAGKNHKYKITSSKVNYHQDNRSFKGYLAKPADNKTHPAVILIHEWWGLNENIQQNADLFAKMGYVALAVDLYEGSGATRDRSIAKQYATKVSKNQKVAFDNLNQAVSFLKKDANTNPKRIGSVGWCFGGGWSYQMAKNNLGIKASVIYYGRFNPADDLSKMRAKILGNFAEKDRVIKVDNVKEFQVKLKNLNNDHEVYIYPNTTHGFANSDNDNYAEAEAKLAQKRTFKFLRKHL